MEFGWSGELVEFRREVKAFVAELLTEDFRKELAAGGAEASMRASTMKTLKDAIDRRGWLKMCWAPEMGGEGRSPWYQYVLSEEMEKADIPNAGVPWVVPAIERFGTDEQKRRYLPGLYSSEITCALGYSEPNAGTDLASLETAAKRDGDDWVINGQKLWTSSAHMSTHVWMMARTNPAAPKHRGISVFIVPLNSPGVTVRPIHIVHGGRTNEVFFENVVVPGYSLIGEENRGWYIGANALDVERVAIGGALIQRKTYETLLQDLRKNRPALLADRAVRLRLAEMKIKLHSQRAIATKNASIVASGMIPTMEASMAKVLGSELRHELSSLAMDITGRSGILKEGEEGSAGDGAFVHEYLMAPQYRFGGGTNEVQRNIIAQRGLGLPR